MKYIVRAALAGALVLVGSAHASDGTINITGTTHQTPAKSASAGPA